MAARKKTTKPWSTRKLATRIAELADEKQAEKIVILDVAQAIQVADYFVLCDGQNRRHLKVIAEHVATELKKEGFHRIGGRPAEDDQWVLLDFGPVVLHCFSAKARGYYDLDNLWGDCPRVRRTRKKAAPAAAGEAPAKPVKRTRKRRTTAEIEIPTGPGFAPPVDE